MCGWCNVKRGSSALLHICTAFPSPLSTRRASRATASYEPAVFLCISMLARAVGGNIEAEMREMLDQMFSAGLTVELTSALQVMAEKIPNLQRDIQGEMGTN